MFGKKNKLFTALLIVCSYIACAQTKSEKKQIKKDLKEAQISFLEEDYYNAWKKYRNVLRFDKKHEEAGLNAIICSYKLGYPVDSASLLVPNLTVSKLPDAKYYLAKIKHQQKLFTQAISLLEEYNSADFAKRLVSAEETNYLISVCKNAIVMVAAPHRAIIKNIGDAVNSPYPDYVPVIVPDESALYFTSRRNDAVNNKKDGYNNFFEDVYVSYKENDIWQKARNIGPPINSETNDACVALSPDGQKMIVYRTSRDQLTGDLYITRKGNNNTWGQLERLGNEVNSQYIETSACFSNDTSEIYFSSNRPGGYGGKDIYRIKKAPNGEWAEPFNLGPSVNTSRDDDAPYLHPDGVTLYFSSQGHNTMGEFDVFKSILNPDDNQFSKAENLGYPINDVGNDIFFVLSVDGQRGYYSSLRPESFGGIDIYQIDTRFGDNDLKVKLGKALVDNVPGRVKITLLDNENEQVNGNYYSDPSTGKFILVINPLKSYKAVVETDGYEPITVQLAPMALEKTDHDLEFKLEKK